MKSTNTRKALIIGIAAFSIAAVSGVGFAAWKITTTDSKTADGNFKANEVVEDDLKIKDFKLDDGDQGTTENNVVFGRPSGTANKDDWLTWDDTDAEESLPTFTCSFSVPENADVIIKLSVSNADAWKTCVTGNYVQFLFDGKEQTGTYTEAATETDAKPASYVYTLAPTPTTESNSKKYSFTLKFDWGSAFGNKNPSEYYRDKEPSSENATAAFTALNTVKDINNSNFTLTVTTSKA